MTDTTNIVFALGSSGMELPVPSGSDSLSNGGIGNNLRLMLAPVKPLDAAVEVGVPPVAVHMVAVVVLGHGAHPEEVTPGDPRLSRVPSRRVLVNQHRLNPVVETNIA